MALTKSANQLKFPLPGSARAAPPHAARFIVTVYGDVVEPRGGALWMGALIDLCGTVGLSESLVRTAVSRLVAADQLVGERNGRRSFYQLTKAARAEFAAASQVIFGPAPNARDWVVAYVADADCQAGLTRQGFARIGAGHVIAPGHLAGLAGDALTFLATPATATASLKDWAAGLWDLARHARAYQDFLASLQDFVAFVDAPDMAQLAARLMLVHDYRAIVLADPRLPDEALPDAWPGAAARVAFARSYLALTPAANRAVSAGLADQRGPLSEMTDAVRAREAGLAELAGFATKSIT